MDARVSERESEWMREREGERIIRLVRVRVIE